MKKRRGFTVIEVLAVMAIIAILASMLFFGAKYMTQSAKKNTTRVMLQNLQAFMTEREAAVGSTKVQSEINSLFTAPGTQLDASVIAVVDKGFPQRYPAAGNNLFATQQVMYLLLASPSNKSAVTGLPAKQLLENATVPNSATPGPILLDGWGYPIICVASDGLINVTLNGVPQGKIRAPNNKPYFASPGPDGDFRTGDDNVYSFEN